jgi:heme-degrading monooxygenase HmoA
MLTLIGGCHVHNTTHPHHNRPVRDRNRPECLEEGVRAIDDSAKGLISEKLLRCRETHELISYSEWATEADIEFYQNSDAHKEIVQHARSLRGSKAQVKLYDLVE